MKQEEEQEGKAVALSIEVQELIDLLEGSRLLVDQIEHSGPSERHNLLISEAIWANISATISRLRLLRKAFTGKIDPALIWSANNDSGRQNDQDIFLKAWPEPTLKERRERMKQQRPAVVTTRQ